MEIKVVFLGPESGESIGAGAIHLGPDSGKTVDAGAVLLGSDSGVTNLESNKGGGD